MTMLYEISKKEKHARSVKTRLKIAYNKLLKVINERYNGEYETTTPYLGVNKKIGMKHKVCGHEWMQLVGEILRKERRVDSPIFKNPCPQCRSVVHVRTYDSLSKEISEITHDEYTIIYENSMSDKRVMTRDKVTFKHITCGNEWEAGVAIFISNGTRCSVCSNKNKVRTFNIEEFFNRFPEKTNIPFKLYFIQLSNSKESFYKIGITTRSLDERRPNDGTSYKYKVLFAIDTNYKKALATEQEILEFYRNDRYIPLEKFCGYTECIKDDISKILIRYFK